MFKRIFSALSGKSGKTSVSTIASPAESKASRSTGNRELISAYDAYGREVKIAPKEWRDKIFLPNLQQKWNDANELYGLILSGLNDGFATDLRPAAERLVEIDSIPERSHSVLGIVLMKNGQLDAAEATLRAGIAKAGATGTLLTNLAKVFAERGEQAQADKTLWQAVQADPNQRNGLGWWAVIQRERDGEAGYLRALSTAAALPGSWLAQLWLARHHLEHTNFVAARALYVQVLEGGLFDSDALMMVSGDLGNNGQPSLIFELIGPVFDEHKHHPMTGLNMLRACQDLSKVDEGEALLARMYALGIPPIKHHLDEFAQAFQEMRKQAATGSPVDQRTLEITTITLDRPIWHYGLRDAEWLFTQKAGGSPEVGFFAFSKITDGTQHAESQREDDLGRLSRAIPLYLAEAAHYWSDYAARGYFLIVEGGGPVLAGGKSDGDALFDIVPSGMEFFVTGEIGCTGESADGQWKITLSLWNCRTRTEQASEDGNASQEDLGALVLALEARLLNSIGLKREQPLDTFYPRPTADVIPVYLAELGQAFMLTMVADNHAPRSGLWGERAMLDYPLNMALRWPESEVPKLMYISGLGKAFDYRSQVLPEYKERSLQLLREVIQANSVATSLAPLIWKAFSMTSELQAHMQNQSANAHPAYKAWLERVAS
ncbi:Tfp pilus assembly protein PilF [Variovorax sp. GrIS 2.14]|uniref:tetratricopeptide repeat protein n=1 Tax=Variovorax sp. GrIS 2.14 TaxID=3071709 RepID=UPI0038F6FB45